MLRKSNDKLIVHLQTVRQSSLESHVTYKFRHTTFRTKVYLASSCVLIGTFEKKNHEKISDNGFQLREISVRLRP